MRRVNPQFKKPNLNPRKRGRDITAMKEQQIAKRKAIKLLREWHEHKQDRLREGYAFVKIGRYLLRQAKLVWPEYQEFLQERRYTALYGCKTSWPLVERAAIYTFVSEHDATKPK